ncbi:DUF882 domain-containing protein [Thermithiobacillus plumbiphilus]|uniref:Murein endopeptidase K n=1 Tax=Thermithiobacillus plumbiphilus TaxID=1729899 RepID=A0ABU9DBG3_9PROT
MQQKTIPDLTWSSGVSRRRFLKLGALSLAGMMLPMSAFASLLERSPAERRLAFYNTHTGESLNTVYWASGDFVSDGLQEIDHILRDFRADEVAAMDRGLLDLLYVLQGQLGARKPFQIISGYRSPNTNAMLRSQSGGVARHSLHMDAKAIDIRLPGVELSHLRDAALGLKAGGVGYYPGSNFVHVDVGRVRRWQG